MKTIGIVLTSAHVTDSVRLPETFHVKVLFSPFVTVMFSSGHKADTTVKQMAIVSTGTFCYLYSEHAPKEI